MLIKTQKCLKYLICFGTVSIKHSINQLLQSEKHPLTKRWCDTRWMFWFIIQNSQSHIWSIWIQHNTTITFTTCDLLKVLLHVASLFKADNNRITIGTYKTWTLMQFYHNRQAYASAFSQRINNLLVTAVGCIMIHLTGKLQVQRHQTVGMLCLICLIHYAKLL